MKLEKLEHSVISPSRLDLFIKCPLAMLLSQKCEQMPTFAMARGTAMHWLANEFWHRRYKSAKKIVEVDNHLIEFDDDMINSVNQYLQIICSYLLDMNNFEVYIEEKFYISQCETAFGYADFVVVSDDEIIIFDYKAGAEPIPSEKNKQLMAYVLGVIERAGSRKKYRGVIVQPSSRDGISVKETEYESWELDRLQIEIVGLIDVLDCPYEYSYSGSMTTEPCGSCNYIHYCPHRSHDANEAFKENDDEQMMAKMVARASVIRKYLDKCEKYILGKAMEGKKFEELKLVRKITHRRWKNTAIDILQKDYGFQMDDISETKLFSLKKIKEMTTKDQYDKIEKELSVKPQGELSIAPLHDRRKSIEISDDFE